ncbi:archaeal proteasome endopeptidase complex subunit beta [Natronobacterium texcoconense]|uniref:Proteasome subunit beta n=1 Tax=Natronobacterium texcoconense TaxID=1095778 RepID=A0A1H1CR40_NATTX|nr:archaeal proteasome endopeptidase complex subunit beta [Natronobacterium texcoconense]SDQ66663.1 proteasome endopeptidase complex, beta component Threonine peptidase. MEROPS family T01A [Natronobacterium texcoconense]
MRTPTHDSDFSRTVDQLADNPNPYEPEVGSLPQNDLTAADLDNVNKTGTTTIGITTEDGVVIATDMRASLGGRFVSNKNVQKVEQIHPTGALTLVGSVGGAQSFIATLRAEVNLYESRRGEDMSIEALANLAGNFARGGPFFAIHPILGGVDDEGSHVFSIDPAGGVMEDDYTVTGSGMQLAYGHLEQAYEDDLTNDEATTVAARAIKSAAERDTGSGNGVFLCEITDEGVDIHGHHDFDEVV